MRPAGNVCLIMDLPNLTMETLANATLMLKMETLMLKMETRTKWKR